MSAGGVRVKSQRNRNPGILAGVSAQSVLLFCFYFFEMGSRCVAQTVLELAMLLSPPLEQAWLIQFFVSKIAVVCFVSCPGVPWGFPPTDLSFVNPL